MSRNLESWRDSVSAFDDILATRDQAYVERVPKADAVLSATDIDALTRKRVEFESRINEIEKSSDVAALGTPAEQATWARLKRIEEYLAAHPDDPDLADMRDKQRLMTGVMYWRLAESFKARVWNERRSVKELEADLKETQRRAVLVQQARQATPANTGQYAVRVAALRARMDGCRAARGGFGAPEPLPAVARHPRTAAPEGAHRDLSDPGPLRPGGHLRSRHQRETGQRQGRHRTAGGRPAPGEAVKRQGPLLIGLAAAMLPAWWAPARAADAPPPTIRDLEGQQVEVKPDPPQGVDARKTMDSYRRFLDLNAGDEQLRAEALRRLGDLNLESSESERIERELVTNEGLRATEAITLYTALLKAYPKYERNDSVLYQLARAYELNAQPDKAMATLDRLVTSYPNSRYIDEAQFRRGELLFSNKAYPGAQRPTKRSSTRTGLRLL